MAGRRRRDRVAAPAAAPAPAPAALTGTRKRKRRAAVAAPQETEAQKWKYFTKYAKGLFKHAANFDASSGDGVTVVLAIVGARSSSRMGAQKAAVNVTAAGQRPVIVYAGGPDDASRKLTFERVMAAVAAAKDGPVEVAQALDAVSGGTSELAPLAQAVFLGSAGGIEDQFAAKKPRTAAPAPAPVVEGPPRLREGGYAVEGLTGKTVRLRNHVRRDGYEWWNIQPLGGGYCRYSCVHPNLLTPCAPPAPPPPGN